jgi:Peptidase propeptide and YPEB domain
MNRSISSHSQFIVSASRKLATTLFVVIAFAASNCPQTILANDAAQPSKGQHAHITQAQAEKAALAKVPGGKVKAAKLSQQNGQPIWSIDILTPLTKKIAAIQVDARTGKVLSKLTEHPGDRAEDTAPTQNKGQ